MTTKADMMRYADFVLLATEFGYRIDHDAQCRVWFDTVEDMRAFAELLEDSPHVEYHINHSNTTITFGY